jgi:hypothetical protein
MTDFPILCLAICCITQSFWIWHLSNRILQLEKSLNMLNHVVKDIWNSENAKDK